MCDQVAAAVRVSDGMLLAVDAVDGVMLGTERVIRQVKQLSTSLCARGTDGEVVVNINSSLQPCTWIE